MVQQGGSLSTNHPKTTRPNNPMSVLRHRKNQNSQWPMHPCFQGSSTDNGQTRIAAGQNLGFLCPVKPNKKYRERVGREDEGSFYSQASRDGNTVGSCLKHCALHPAYEESRGLYKARAHSQESVMRNKGDRILISSSCIVFLKGSHKLVSVTQ